MSNEPIKGWDGKPVESGWDGTPVVGRAYSMSGGTFHMQGHVPLETERDAYSYLEWATRQFHTAVERAQADGWQVSVSVRTESTATGGPIGTAIYVDVTRKLGREEK